MSVDQFEITPHDLKKLLDEGAVHLVDVREHFEYLEAHIENACLIPSSTFEPDQLNVIPDKKLVFYCRSGGRSAFILEKWHALQNKISGLNLTGGIEAWKKAGLPIICNS